MGVKITAVAKQLPKYFRETKDIIPFVRLWMRHQDERFQRKVIKLFEGAAVDKRYSIMNPEEVFTATSFEQKKRYLCKRSYPTSRKVIKEIIRQSKVKTF